MTAFPTETLGATHPERDDGPRRFRNHRLTIAAFRLFLVLLVGSAVLDTATEVDVWGPSTDTVRASGGGYELSVRYPTVSRPALATPFDIVVRREGGFNGPVDIAIDPNWFEMWDFQALNPSPSEETAEPTRLIWTFEPPDGEVLRIFFDGRIQPAEQSGRGGYVAVLDDGVAVAQVTFTSAIRP